MSDCEGGKGVRRERWKDRRKDLRREDNLGVEMLCDLCERKGLEVWRIGKSVNGGVRTVKGLNVAGDEEWRVPPG